MNIFNTDINVADLAYRRHSCKAFDPEAKIPPDLFHQLAEVLRLAPSSVNSQPWHFFVATSDAGKQQLASATPGPLIMVVAFVGFVGGYVKAVFGPDSLFLAGAVAATLVTWFTFLPSFLFILAGGPLVESTHNDLHFTAPLTAITAAVVGVILNLALFFGYHVLWPQGFAGAFDWPAAVIAIAAAVALFRFKRGVMEVIGVCAVAGLLLH